MRERSLAPSGGALRLVVEASLIGSASLILLLVLAASPAAATSFAPAFHYPTGMGPRALAVADFNGDGKADVVTVNDDGASLLIGDGRGHFAAPTPVPCGFFTEAVAVADVNADGKPDLATVDWEGILTVLLGDGQGGFAASAVVPEAGGPPVVGDFDGDGTMDVATTSALFFGDGAGGLSLGGVVPSGPGPGGLVAADLNEDGDLDLVTTNSVWDEIQATRVLLGDGAGQFPESQLYSSYLEPSGVAVGDLDRDGHLDVVTASGLEGDYVFEVLLGDGTGAFTEGRGGARSLGSVDLSGPVRLADVDGDARLDVVSLKGVRTALVQRGDGRGGLRSEEDFRAGSGATDVAVADLNRDGMLDLVTADYRADAVSVLLNGPRAAPVLSGLSPLSGRVGSVVTLTGAHFGAHRVASVVRFGAVTATAYPSWSATRIKVRVPEGTLAGSVKVRVQTVAGRSAAKAFRRL